MIKVFLLSVLLIFWIGIFPGIRGANDFPYVFNEAVSSGFNFPFVWSSRGSEGLGQDNVATLWAYPIDLLYGLGAKLGLDFWVLERVIGILPILLLGGLGIFKLLGYYKFSDWPRFIGSIFFLANTYILQLVDGGQLTVGLAYAWIPTCFLLWSKALDGNFKNAMMAALSVVLLGFFDIRFVYIFFLLLSIYFLFKISFEVKINKNLSLYLIKWIRIGILFAVFFLGLNFYWIFPLVVSRASFLPTTYTRESQLSFLNFANIGHGILLQQPHWYQNIFGQVSNLKVEFILLPIFTVLAVLLRKKDKAVGFWLLTLLIGIFLIKGPNEPFGNVYKWLFNNFPGFSLFRDSTKFYVFICLSYSFLIAVFVEEVAKLNPKNILLKKFIGVVPILVLIYITLLASPAYLGKMSGMLSFPNFQKEYLELATLLQQDNGFSRVLWVPRRPPLGFTSPNHPILEAANLVEKRAYAIGVKGSYERLNFLREASFSGQLLDIAGVGYIAFPFLDSKREEVNTDRISYYYTFLNQIENLPWVEGKLRNFPIPVIKTRKHQDRLFLAPNLYWVVGSDDIYNEATKSASLALSKNALVFAEEIPGLSSRVGEFPNLKIVLNKKTPVDLAANFIDSKNLIFPAKNLGFQPDKTGWWKREAADLISWRDFLQSKYKIDNLDFDLGGGWAVAEGSLELKVNSEKFKRGSVLLARAMESSQSGAIIFFQGKREIGRVNTFKKESKGSNIRWFEVGKLASGDPLTIKTQGNINILNCIGLVDKNIWEIYLAQAIKLQDKITNFNDQNISSTSAKLTFKQINPTKYSVIISGLTAPGIIVLSQSYDPLWKMGNQTSVPAYSLLNGFLVNSDGQYIIEYSAQKYVYYGLAISLATAGILGLYLLREKYKETRQKVE